MKAKLDKLSEISNLLSQKDIVNNDLIRLFSRFGLSQLLRRLSLEKEYGVSVVQLILSLCLIRFNGESIHSLYRKRFYGLLDTGKNCYYRLLNRSAMDWRKLHLGMASRFLSILRKEHAEESNGFRTYALDDTPLEKSGLKIERVSRVFDHGKGHCVLGYKLLILAFFDGRSTIPIDFSLHREMGKKGNGGLTDKQLKEQYTKKRKPDAPGSDRIKESNQSKLEVCVAMMQRAWKQGIRADYVLTDSWFTCEYLIESVRKLGKGALHFVGLAKMGNTKYEVSGRKHNAHELIALHERKKTRSCRKYKCRYIQLKGVLGNQPVQIFLIRYGHNANWNIMITSNLSLDFVKCFEIYQIRWNIEVLIKECKSYLKLGTYQGRDFDGQIADCTLCFITHIVISLDKRFSDYETMGALFAAHRDDLMALTLWKRILDCICRIMQVLAEVLGQTPEELLERMLQDERVAEKSLLLLRTLETHYSENEGVA